MCLLIRAHGVTQANAVLAKPALQCGAEIFAEYEQKIIQSMTGKIVMQNVPVISTKAQ